VCVEMPVWVHLHPPSTALASCCTRLILSAPAWQLICWLGMQSKQGGKNGLIFSTRSSSNRCEDRVGAGTTD
jgi:hypothetical protein